MRRTQRQSVAAPQNTVAINAASTNPISQPAPKPINSAARRDLFKLAPETKKPPVGGCYVMRLFAARRTVCYTSMLMCGSRTRFSLPNLGQRAGVEPALLVARLRNSLRVAGADLRHRSFVTSCQLTWQGICDVSSTAHQPAHSLSRLTTDPPDWLGLRPCAATRCLLQLGPIVMRESEILFPSAAHNRTEPSR